MNSRAVVASSPEVLVADALKVRLDLNRPNDASMSEPLRDALAQLASSRDLRNELERLDAQTVALARSQRARWDEIATVTGVSINSARKRWGDAPSSVESRLSHAKPRGGREGLSMKDAAAVLGATVPTLHNWVNNSITQPAQRSVLVEREFRGWRVTFVAQNEPLGAHRRQWRIIDITNSPI